MSSGRSISSDSTDNFETTAEPGALGAQDWELAFRVLGEQLARHDGCVSAVALRREMEKNGGSSARPLVVDLQLFDAESSRERGILVPSFEFGYLGRSFYSAQKLAEAQEG